MNLESTKNLLTEDAEPGSLYHSIEYIAGIIEDIFVDASRLYESLG